MTLQYHNASTLTTLKQSINIDSFIIRKFIYMKFLKCIQIYGCSAYSEHKFVHAGILSNTNIISGASASMFSCYVCSVDLSSTDANFHSPAKFACERYAVKVVTIWTVVYWTDVE